MIHVLKKVQDYYLLGNIILNALNKSKNMILVFTKNIFLMYNYKPI